MKSPQAFRSIGEVAQLVGVATHVLRYWETQFSALAPVRRPDGRRYYRPDDLLLAAGLCEIMREDGLTIRGARRLIELDKGAALRERGRTRLEALLTSPSSETDSRTRTRGNGRQRAAAKRTMHKPRPTDTAATTGGLTGNNSEPSGLAAVSMGDGASGWLARLDATATALRGWSGPLPHAAARLSQALRAAALR